MPGPSAQVGASIQRPVLLDPETETRTLASDRGPRAEEPQVGQLDTRPGFTLCDQAMTAAEIQKARIELGLSQETLAHEVPCSVGTLCRWETGKAKPSRWGEAALKEALVRLRGAQREG